jgi:hypothetical protein
VTECAAHILVASVIVIAFARKRDAQPFIAVEDVWGGFFIGFLAGYVGEQFLRQVIPSAQSEKG